MLSESLEKEIGFVRATKHYLLTIEGLPSARVYDILTDEQGGRALVTALSHDAVYAMVLDPMDCRPGQRFEIVSRERQFAVGDHLLGRAINALGDPVDGKGAFPPKNQALTLDVEAAGLDRRAPIRDQLRTGFSMIDTVLPMAKGQRQLLMGPVRSGTELFAQSVIKNQVTENVLCIYAAIGKPATYIREIADTLLSDDTARYTVLVAVSADDPTPQIRIAPSVALMLAEHWSNKGRDVLLVLDDLYTHAKYLREVALLEGKLPGRESYPGDIFYQQAQLIERAGSFTGAGTITMLPMLQTDIENYTDLITTNVMGTTDGHLTFSSEQFAQGMFPPVVVDESVTRVGRHAQSIVQKQLSTAIMSLLADATAQERFAQFGTQLSAAAQQVLHTGAILRLLLNQTVGGRLEPEAQVILLSLPLTSFSTDRDAAFFAKNKRALEEAASMHPDLETLRAAVHTAPGHAEYLTKVEKSVPFFNSLCRP